MPRTQPIKYLIQIFIKKEYLMGLVQSTGLCYSFFMLKSVIIGGNEYPATAALVQASLDTEKNVMVAVSDNEGEVQTPGNGACSYAWHKTSPVSTRAMLLESENKFEGLDCAFIVFDAQVFSSKYNALSLENISRGNDEMLVSMEYLTYEILKRFEINKKGLLCFVLNPVSALSDITRNPRLMHDSVPLAPLAAAAQSGFRSFAENIAATSTISKLYKVLLVEQGLESREDLANWLLPFASEYFDSKKNYNAKESVKWMHIGAKLPSSHSFFSR